MPAGKELNRSKRSLHVQNAVNLVIGIKTKITMANPCAQKRTNLGQMTPMERERAKQEQNPRRRRLKRERDVSILPLGKDYAEVAAEGYGETALCI